MMICFMRKTQFDQTKFTQQILKLIDVATEVTVAAIQYWTYPAMV